MAGGGSTIKHLLFLIRKNALDDVQTIDPAGDVALQYQAVRARLCAEQVHALQDLFKNVANRQELTKVVTARLLERGSFKFEPPTEVNHLDAVLPAFTVKAQCLNPDGRLQCYDEAALEDLKGRALLQINSHSALKQRAARDSSEGENATAYLKAFIDVVRLVLEIKADLSHLYELGHFSYLNFQAEVPLGIAELELAYQQIREAKKAWNGTLAALRARHYFINFVFGSQLGMMADFLTGHYDVGTPQTCAAMDIVHFIEPLAKGDAVLSKWHAVAQDMGAVESKGEDEDNTIPRAELQSPDPYNRLRALAETLDIMFKTLPRHAITPKAWDNQQPQPPSLIPEGRIVVTPYKNDRDVFATVLSLYDKLEGVRGLQRHRLLVCGPSTSIAELDMFAHRVFHPLHPHGGLYCVLGIHHMSHDCLAYLSKALLRAYRRHQETQNVYLAFVLPISSKICIEELSFPICSVAPLPLDRMQAVMKQVQPDVIIVNSPMAGLGKTEYIKGDAAERYGRGVHTVSVRDDVTRAMLAANLKALGLSRGVCLHFDVSTVDHIDEVNMAFFELLVLGSIQTGTQIAHLPVKTKCYVEVANAIGPRGPLRTVLFALDSFREEMLVWDVERLIVSMETGSDIQVVCNYLQLIDEGTINTRQLILDGPEKNITALDPAVCKQLLMKYFYGHFDEAPSLNTLRAFMGVLADQLRKFSESCYFQLNYLVDHTVRMPIVMSLVNFSCDFATRSIRHVRQRQGSTITEEAIVVPEWTKGMVGWDDNNQLMIVFHPGGHSLTALYRRLDNVDPNIRNLIETQGRVILPDYFRLSDKELRNQLAMICGEPSPENLGPSSYVLTADNLLKVVMIITRVQAGIPVIIMGETGCGKTSLIRFAASCMGAKLEVLDVHAGRSEEDIIGFVESCEQESREGTRVWAFLDEINTSGYLGLINDIVCHRTIRGRPVAHEVTFFCAVNPYRLKVAGGITAGLDLEQKRKSDLRDKLVYRVNPLPETMIDYLWDFGSLQPQDEASYVKAIMEDLEGFPSDTSDVMSDLVVAAHQVIRDREDCSAVSMRDVRRARRLLEFFFQLKLAPVADPTSGIGQRVWNYVKSRTRRQRGRNELACESMVLAVAFCYRSRLPLQVLRHEMEEVFSGVFKRHGYRAYDEKRIADIILDQQREFVEQMDLGPGIAMNESLLENSFVLVSYPDYAYPFQIRCRH